MVALSDESLLAGLASGDAEAAAAFVRRFQGRLYGLAFTILGDRQAAEDVAQEAFLRAWKNASVYDPRRGAVATWLLTIARNIAVDHARVRRSAPMDPDAILMLERADSPDDPDEPLIAAEATERLRRALVDLPVEQRRALVLAAFYGRTAAEISEQEQTPIGTVKTRIRTAMLKLRSKLEVNDER